MVDNEILSADPDAYNDFKFNILNSDNEVIQLHPDMGTSYESPSGCGISIFSFRIDAPGTYKFKAENKNDRNGPNIIIALTKNYGQKILKIILSLIVIITIFFPTACYIAYSTYKKRKAFDQQFTSNIRT